MAAVDLKWLQFPRNIFIKNVFAKNRRQVNLLSIGAHRTQTLKSWRGFSWIHCGFSVLCCYFVSACVRSIKWSLVQKKRSTQNKFSGVANHRNKVWLLDHVVVNTANCLSVPYYTWYTRSVVNSSISYMIETNCNTRLSQTWILEGHFFHL